MIRVILIVLSMLMAMPALAQDDAVTDDSTITDEGTPIEPKPAALEAVTGEAVDAAAVEDPATEDPAAEDPTGAPAEDSDVASDDGVPADIEGAVETVSSLVSAIQGKVWPVVVGLALVLVVFVARKLGLGAKVPAKWTPWITMLLAMLATVGTALGAGVAVTDAIYQGIVTGVMAMGAWDLTKIFRGTATRGKASDSGGQSPA